MIVMIYEPGKTPYAYRTKNLLKTCRELVGEEGELEVFLISIADQEHFQVIVNKYADQLKLTPNRRFYLSKMEYEVLRGTFILTEINDSLEPISMDTLFVELFLTNDIEWVSDSDKEALL